jgi:predicted pyridoxine 5'-phosphate oxidase superfamily flavin-nucleotide-binding protein
MTKITQDMKDLVAAQQCFVATVNSDGTPEVGPKRSTRVLDDFHLAFNEVTGGATWANVSRGSKVAVAVVDRDKRVGFRFVGSPEIITSGATFDTALAMMQKAGIQAPLKGVVKIKVEKIFNLGFPGAGKEIE